MFNQLLLNGIIAGSSYALIALGFTVIYIKPSVFSILPTVETFLLELILAKI